MLDSVRAASKPPEQVCTAAMELREPANPVAVLSSADIQAIQGRGVQVPLFINVASFVFLGVFFGLSVKSVRDKQTGQFFLIDRAGRAAGAWRVGTGWGRRGP